jgi:glycogen phosphorylase
LNLSILDGWWLEGYDETNGFAIGNGNDNASVAEMDSADAESLYRTLELEVVPVFYNRDNDGFPRNWIAMMKRAIQTLAPRYNSDRMVEDYARQIYSV